MTLIGGDGNDRLVGTPFDDVLTAALGNDTVTGGEGHDIFRDDGGTDTLIEQFDADIGLFDNSLVVGQIVGDGKVQVITSHDGVPPTYEVQRIQHQATGGTFTLTFNGQTTAAIAFDADASDDEGALEALSNIASVNVTKSRRPPAPHPDLERHVPRRHDPGTVEHAAAGRADHGGRLLRA